MSRICEVCAKSYKKGNIVSTGIGQRVSNRAITRQQPNLRNKRFEIDGITYKVKLCASCLKRIKFEKKALEAIATESQETETAL